MNWNSADSGDSDTDSSMNSCRSTRPLYTNWFTHHRTNQNESWLKMKPHPVAGVISGHWRCNFHTCTRHECALSEDRMLFLCAHAAAALALTKGLKITLGKSKTRLPFAWAPWIFIRFLSWFNTKCSPWTSFFVVAQNGTYLQNKAQNWRWVELLFLVCVWWINPEKDYLRRLKCVYYICLSILCFN